MPVGNIANFIILDRELIERTDLNLVEKVVYAYIRANQECLPAVQTPDYCAHFLDLSEGEVTRAWKHLMDLHMIEEEF